MNKILFAIGPIFFIACHSIKNDMIKTGYIFDLTQEEKTEVIKIFDNHKVKLSPTVPSAFTEKGLYMLATILKSPTAKISNIL
jgi:hypothetical protein